MVSLLEQEQKLKGNNAHIPRIIYRRVRVQEIEIGVKTYWPIKFKWRV